MPTSNTLTTRQQKNARKTPKKQSQKSSPFTTALIPLPSLDAISSYIPYTAVEIENSQLAKIGLLLTNVFSSTSVERPGPWDRKTDTNNIKAELVSWLDDFLPIMKSSCDLLEGYALSIGYSRTNDNEYIFLELYCAHEIYAMYCAILPELSKVEKAVESIVRAAFKTLAWMNPSYTYDDVIEQIQDHAEDELHFNEVDENERSHFTSIMEWIKTLRSEDRYFLRVDERPIFPSFTQCPEKSSWTYSWWQWAKTVEEASRLWKKPIQYFQSDDVTGDQHEILDPGYLEPFLWAERDYLEEWHFETLDCEAQSGYEAVLFYPMNTESVIKESLENIKMLFQWKRLFHAGCLLSMAEQQGEIRS